MNEYLITFRRFDGSLGADSFTAADEHDTREQFRACYRHGISDILSTIPATGAVCGACESKRIWPGDRFCRNCGAAL
jgi:hypothetical protein